MLGKMGRTHMQNIFQRERSKLFHYLLQNPLKYKTPNQGRIAKTTKDYFAQTYQKNDPEIWNEIDKATKFVFKNNKMIEDYVDKFNPNVEQQ